MISREDKIKMFINAIGDIKDANFKEFATELIAMEMITSLWDQHLQAGNIIPHLTLGMAVWLDIQE